jgi:hypothetical protein
MSGKFERIEYQQKKQILDSTSRKVVRIPTTGDFCPVSVSELGIH